MFINKFDYRVSCNFMINFEGKTNGKRINKFHKKTYRLLPTTLITSISEVR